MTFTSTRKTSPGTSQATYKAVLFRTVSREVLRDLDVSAAQAELSAPASPALWVSLLARMRLWLTVFFRAAGEVDVLASVDCKDHLPPLNRRAARSEKRWASAAPSSYALGHILLRRYDYARFVQWLYDFSLVGRARFCFVTRRCLLWARRKAVAVFKASDRAARICADPLSPD